MPAALSDSISRYTVRTDTSSSSATSRAVTRSRVCRSNRIDIRRLARICRILPRSTDRRCQGSRSTVPPIPETIRMESETGVTAMPFIETRDGARLFYRDWGAGRPVLFLSAWAMDSSEARAPMLHLAEHGLRAISLDRRGHGRSDDPGRGYDYD